MKVPVLTVADGGRWEAQLVGELVDGAHPIAVSRRCVDVVDLLAVAASGQGRAALVAAGLRGFDADAVDRLRAAGVVPVAVVERGDSAAAEKMARCGVQYTVPVDADPAVVSSVVMAALSGPPPASDRAFGGGLPRGGATPRGATAVAPEPTADRAAGAASYVPPATGSARRSRGRVIAVWGPTGAPGRTTIATCLADEVARLGSSALIIDADVYGGSVATGLGLIDESPGLVAACRSASARRLDAATLATWCWQLRPSLRVLTGIAFSRRWPEVRTSAIGTVLNAARGLVDVTVVDCGFALEADEELAYDSLVPRRNGATLAVLDDADVVVAVGAADPVGVQRLVRGLGDLREAGVRGPVRIALNRCRSGVVPGDPPTELTAVLRRLAGQEPEFFLPYDRDALDAATAAGRLVGEIRPASPLRRAVVEMAAALTGRPVPAARHRRTARAGVTDRS